MTRPGADSARSSAARWLNAAGLVLSLVLLALGLWGRVAPPEYRDRFAEPLLSYDEAIARLDAAHAAQGDTAAFVAEAAPTARLTPAASAPYNRGG